MTDYFDLSTVRSLPAFKLYYFFQSTFQKKKKRT